MRLAATLASLRPSRGLVARRAIALAVWMFWTQAMASWKGSWLVNGAAPWFCWSREACCGRDASAIGCCSTVRQPCRGDERHVHLDVSGMSLNITPDASCSTTMTSFTIMLCQTPVHPQNHANSSATVMNSNSLNLF